MREISSFVRYTGYDDNDDGGYSESEDSYQYTNENDYRTILRLLHLVLGGPWSVMGVVSHPPPASRFWSTYDKLWETDNEWL